jgi:uncharacterized protein YjbI with pentapeptide repeats
MSSLRATVGLVLLGLLIVPSAHSEETDACPYPEGRTIEDLGAALAAHAEWLERRRNPDGDALWQLLERAPLDAHGFCNANLRQADLEGADLRLADLEGANLVGANLSEANLQGANLSETRLERANLEGAILSADLEGANLALANLEGADLIGANLEGARLGRANLEGANLALANLEGADLIRANLEGAKLLQANLEGAKLLQANLEGASLVRASLERASLLLADLEAADLAEANLQGAVLDRTDLENARIFRVDLSEALYQPATAPAQGYLSGLKGLRSITFCPGEDSGLVQLRQALKTAGLRELEREATYTLERLRTEHALARWNGLRIGGCADDLERDRWAAIEGFFRLIFFELTTDYGLAYGRPILILLGLILVFTFIYLPALLLVPKRPDHDGGVYRVWPKGRIKRSGESFELADDEIVEPLKVRDISALGLAFYFSVISAFHLGWRDLNVGTWIARMQPREYTLRAKGWVRLVSGIQSLISVYLIAIWVLTYFGRPFE